MILKATVLRTGPRFNSHYYPWDKASNGILESLRSTEYILRAS